MRLAGAMSSTDHHAAICTVEERFDQGTSLLEDVCIGHQWPEQSYSCYLCRWFQASYETYRVFPDNVLISLSLWPFDRWDAYIVELFGGESAFLLRLLLLLDERTSTEQVIDALREVCPLSVVCI